MRQFRAREPTREPRPSVGDAVAVSPVRRTADFASDGLAVLPG